MERLTNMERNQCQTVTELMEDYYDACCYRIDGYFDRQKKGAGDFSLFFELYTEHKKLYQDI